MTLLIFGFDGDQKAKGLNEIQGKLSAEGIKYYSKGNISTLEITSLWNA